MRSSSKWIAALLLALTGTALAPNSAAQEVDAQRAFSFPLTRDARDQANVALEHLEAARWRQAIEVLQEIVEFHRGAVLPDAFRASASLPSAHAAHPGAAQWAREKLLSLPREARALYRDKFERAASFAASKAIENGNRRDLVGVAARWPLCDGSIRAWRVLGDIELESGNPRAALIAWDAAERAASVVYAPEAAAAHRASIATRREAALDALAGSNAPGDGAPTPNSTAIAPDPSLERGPLPSRDADPWRRELDLSPFARESVVARQFDYALQPDLAVDKVLVNTTLKLYCVDAYTGELEWTGPEHYGWSFLSAGKRKDLFEGLDRNQTLVAPAHGGRIAIAAMQLPFSELPNQEYQGIEVMKSIPQRRLFAFDLETGAPLWNHAPELEWNEDRNLFTPARNQNYAQRMLVAGPPVVAGARVLVPCYVLAGRIDYHVACYDLASGDLLWSTSIVSGQTSRNMFGRALKEFCATPVVVSEDRVIVQTELGTIAAVDLMTGRILWESLYRQVALPKTPGYQPQPRRLTWRLAPPVVNGDVIVATPSDSNEIAAFDATDGRVLWTYDQDSLAQLENENRRSTFNVLLGVDDDTVYLSGTRVGALRKDGGLRQPGAFHLIWDYPISNAYTADRSPRPLLCADTVLVPTPTERVVLGRRDGRVRHSLSAAWTSDQNGNALVDRGLLFTLGAVGLHGFFDWDLLIDRQKRRMAAAPGDAETAIATAMLYSRRANTALEDGELFAARDDLASARGILEPLVFPSGADRPDAGASRSKTRASDELHTVLRREARAFDAQGAEGAALDAIRQARPLARSLVALRDTLLQEESLLRGTGREDEHLGVLAELDTTCGDLLLPADAAREANFPVAVNQDEVYGAPTIGLWVLFTRAGLHEQLGALGAAFEDLHGVIDRYAHVELTPSVRAGAVARQRIRSKLLLPGGRDAYGRFELAASELYERAIEASDVEQLIEVSRRFPHATAARAAEAARLDWAYEASDADAVASIVYGSPDAPYSRFDPPALIRLGRVLGRLGNVEFERGLLTALTREDPTLTSDLAEHGPRPLTEVLAELDAERTTYEPVLPRFGDKLIDSPIEIGSYEFVGRFLTPTEAEVGPEELHVYLVRRQTARGSRADEFVDTVDCFSSRAPGTPTWRAFLQDGVRSLSSCAMSAERVVFGGQRMVQALDMEGREVWRRPVPLPVTSLCQDSGVVVAMLGLNSPEYAVAFDAHTGIPLWQIALGEPGSWRKPAVGEGKIVFFSKPYSRATTARIVDLFRGTLVTDVDLGTVLEPQVEGTVWIDSGKLFLPAFRSVGKDKPRVTAYDLHTGRELWEREVPENEDFEYIARHDGATYLVTRAGSTDGNGGIYLFDDEFGTLRRIVPLRAPELPIGLAKRAVTEIPTAEIFTYVEDTNQMIVRSMHLPYQARWSWSLPVRGLAGRNFMPLPAVSENCVAIAYALTSPDSGFAEQAQLVIMDRHTGKRLVTRLIDEEFAKASRLELRGLGDACFIAGRGSATRGWRFQILENHR